MYLSALTCKHNIGKPDRQDWRTTSVHKYLIKMAIQCIHARKYAQTCLQSVSIFWESCVPVLMKVAQYQVHRPQAWSYCILPTMMRSAWPCAMAAQLGCPLSKSASAKKLPALSACMVKKPCQESREWLHCQAMQQQPMRNMLMLNSSLVACPLAH